MLNYERKKYFITSYEIRILTFIRKNLIFRITKSVKLHLYKYILRDFIKNMINYRALESRIFNPSLQLLTYKVWSFKT